MSVELEIPDHYLWCRDVMHSWDPYNARISRSKSTRRNEVHQVLLCTRCGTYKTRIMSTTGDLLRSTYAYPDGYLLKEHGPMTPADRSMVRRINFQQSLNESSSE